ncbi:MAG: TrmH family RNA methyltransferase [Pirellulaceae bacterium]
MSESIETAAYGKRKKPTGIAPAIALVNPKFPHNVGKAVRAASCFGVKQVWFTGSRVSLEPRGKKYRLPREERMKGYRDVELRQFDQFFDQFDRDVVPVAVELRADSENLMQFEHPERALYVFGTGRRQPRPGQCPALPPLRRDSHASLRQLGCSGLPGAVRPNVQTLHVRRRTDAADYGDPG